jgi:pimeloyl-ACP methyl ester carboxylesterase
MKWLLLRGLGREQRHWYDFPERVRTVVAPDQVLALDLAGAGTERGRLPVPSVAWLARDVARRALAAEAGGPQLGDAGRHSFSVIGLSLGGMVALELAWLWPERIADTLIINASCNLTPLRSRLMPAAAVGLVRTLLARHPVQRERRALELTSALPRERRDELAHQAAAIASPSALAFLGQLSAAARFFPPPPGSVRPRLAFLGSRGDRLVSVTCSRDLARCYGAPYEEHPWAGHDLTLDDPDWVCERVARIRAERSTAER